KTRLHVGALRKPVYFGRYSKRASSIQQQQRCEHHLSAEEHAGATERRQNSLPDSEHHRAQESHSNGMARGSPDAAAVVRGGCPNCEAPPQSTTRHMRSSRTLERKDELQWSWEGSQQDERRVARTPRLPHRHRHG